MRPASPLILTFSFKHCSHIFPQGRALLGLLWMLQLHPGAGLGGQGDQELLWHADTRLGGPAHSGEDTAEPGGEASQLGGHPQVTVSCPDDFHVSVWLLEAAVSPTPLKNGFLS